MRLHHDDHLEHFCEDSHECVAHGHALKSKERLNVIQNSAEHSEQTSFFIESPNKNPNGKKYNAKNNPKQVKSSTMTPSF